MTGSILIVDDDPVLRRLLEAAVTRFGYATILADDALRSQWIGELAGMRDRIKEMRRKLVDGLAAAGVTAENGKKDMSFIAEQVGMFSYSGLSKEQMVELREKHGVYGTDKGRICVAALNDSNIDYVCQAIAAVM